MSVYTSIAPEELRGFLSAYAVGELVSYEGILAGLENSNYYVTTTMGEYVLTLFESHSEKEVGYFLDVTRHLADHRLPTANPIADRDGVSLKRLAGKPAALVMRMVGQSVDRPSQGQVAELGAMLGRMHRVGRDYGRVRGNDRGPLWWRGIAGELLAQLPSDEAELLRFELAHHTTTWPEDLPQGLIHADLFRDNVLFSGESLTALLDFNNACTDMLMFDVAICLNDWCSEADGRLDMARAVTLLSAYQRARTLTQQECQALPLLLRAAALRFWISRLKHRQEHPGGDLVHSKDPDEIRDILEWRQKETAIIQGLFT